jgi:hypothetical protein
VCHYLWDSINILQENLECIKEVIRKLKTKTDGQYNGEKTIDKKCSSKWNTQN